MKRPPNTNAFIAGFLLAVLAAALIAAEKRIAAGFVEPIQRRGHEALDPHPLVLVDEMRKGFG